MRWNKKPITTLALVLAIGATNAIAQSWSRWERQHAVSQQKTFLVIKQPGEGFCYVKQSYDNDTSKMELIFSGSAPLIITPFYRGIDGDVKYWVDSDPKRTVSSSEINGTSSFKLATDVVNEMKAGQTLYVRVKPLGEPERTQEFSLLGFTAAVRALNGPECQEDGGAPVSPNLEVKLRRNLSGGVIVSGKTSLPNGMNLMISLRAKSGGFFAQDKAQVHSGSYESAGFTNKGSALLAGKYRVSISSPLMSFQPTSVKQKLGSSGSGIPKDIREKSSYSENYTVNYSVSRSVK